MNDLLTPKEAAKYLRISIVFLKRLRKDDNGPPFIRLGKKTIRYSKQALEDWLSNEMLNKKNMENINA